MPWLRNLFIKKRDNDAATPGCRSCGRPTGDNDPVLTCPGCGAGSEIIATAIAQRTLNDGPQARPCTACELVTIVLEPNMVCPACKLPRPDVNDRLRARFAKFGPGNSADAPCVGCGYYVTEPYPHDPPLNILIDCQGCGAELAIPEAAFHVGQGMHLRHDGCRSDTVIPSTVWCPKCGLRLRRRGIPELIRDANRRSDVYEIGILFDIDALGGGVYGQKAYKILFDSLDPQRLRGCSFHDGDTNTTIAGSVSLYCIVIRSSDPLKIDYVRDALSARTDDGLLTVNRRFTEGDITSKEPLVQAGDVDGAGDLVVRPDDMIQEGWTEGTVWKIVTK